MKRAVILFTLTLVLHQSSAYAYETDVHLGLTAVLARLAGFKPADAIAIANADQALDRDQLLADGKRHDAVHVVTDEIIFESDRYSRTEASRRVQFDHFPGVAPLPDEPKNRTVAAGPNNGLMPVRLQALSKMKQRDNKWLELIGYTLHPYQDSWSHAGIPDIAASPVWEFRSGYAWGHPDRRGGWSHHRADLTCADTTSTLEMAEATFDQLRKLCDLTSGTACVSPGWTKELKSKIMDFAAVDTRLGKRKWLVDMYKATGLPEFEDSLSDIDLPWDFYNTQRSGFVTKCVEIPKRSAAVINRSVASIDSALAHETRHSSYMRRVAFVDEHKCEADPGLKSVSKQFIDWWLTESPSLRRRDFLGTEGKARDQNFTRFLDSDHMQIQLRAWLGEKKIEDPNLWPAVFLRIWLIEDHGIVEALGHADPTSPQYEKLRIVLFDEDRFRAEKPDSRLLKGISAKSVDPSKIESRLEDIFGEDFSVGGGLTSCALNIRFSSRLPRDTVTFVFVGHPNSYDWKIVRLSWLSL
ncbi:MAG TPA: DUF6765 family protein [Burkholderiales bacterium]|nr:DUF6765 family protein [Burkholderiales bacterium]